MFKGLSAFPITPANEDGVDFGAYRSILKRLVEARVESIGALGTTGNYPYFTTQERVRIIETAVDESQGIPVLAGIGALRTKDVLENAELVQRAGASAVLFSPMSYQTLTEDEVFGLYSDVTAQLSVPLCLYDNPITTKFSFSDDLYAAISRLPQVAVVKVPAVPTEADAATRRANELRHALQPGTNIGVSGDASAAAGLIAGFDVWFSVLGGILPVPCKDLTDAALSGNHERALEISHQLEPVWKLNAEFGSLRVTSAIASEMRMTLPNNLPRPLLPLPSQAWARVLAVVAQLRAYESTSAY